MLSYYIDSISITIFHSMTYNKTLHIYLVYILCCIIILHTYTYIIIISIYVLLLNIYNIMIYIQCIYNY